MNKCFSKKKTLIAVVISLAAFNASAAWTVNGTFCQTNSEDGRVIVRVKPSTVGLIEMKPQCNGRGAFGLTAQTQFYTVQTTMATKDIRSIIKSFSKSDSVSVNTFGGAFSVNTADFSKVCASIIGQQVAENDPQETLKRDMKRMGYEQGPDGQWHKRSLTATQ